MDVAEHIECHVEGDVPEDDTVDWPPAEEESITEGESGEMEASTLGGDSEESSAAGENNIRPTGPINKNIFNCPAAGASMEGTTTQVTPNLLSRLSNGQRVRDPFFPMFQSLNLSSA